MVNTDRNLQITGEKMNISFIGSLVLASLILVSRFIPSADNFSPLLALCLFVGFLGQKNWYSLVLPLVAMFIADSIVGFYPGWAFTYIPLVGIVLLGQWMKLKIPSVVGYSILSSLIFFVVSNFGVWWSTALYSKNMSGLIQCYVAAIPFLDKTVLSTLLYSAILFVSLREYSKIASRKAVEQ